MHDDSSNPQEAYRANGQANRGSAVCLSLSRRVFDRSTWLLRRAMFGTADPNSPSFAGPSNTPWIPTRTQPRIEDRPPPVSSHDIDSRLGLTQLSGELTAHLLERTSGLTPLISGSFSESLSLPVYQALPQSWLPLFPRGRLSLMFESVGRRIEALPPQAEVRTLSGSSPALPALTLVPSTGPRPRHHRPHLSPLLASPSPRPRTHRASVRSADRGLPRRAQGLARVRSKEGSDVRQVEGEGG